MLEKTREWLEATTGSPKTEDEAKWFLAFWYGRSFHENTTKEMAEIVQYFCENGISYDSIETDFFTQMQECRDEGEYREEEWEGEARDFYGI